MDNKNSIAVGTRVSINLAGEVYRGEVIPADTDLGCEDGYATVRFDEDGYVGVFPVADLLIERPSGISVLL